MSALQTMADNAINSRGFEVGKSYYYEHDFGSKVFFRVGNTMNVLTMDDLNGIYMDYKGRRRQIIPDFCYPDSRSIMECIEISDKIVLSCDKEPINLSHDRGEVYRMFMSCFRLFTSSSLRPDDEYFIWGIFREAVSKLNVCSRDYENVILVRLQRCVNLEETKDWSEISLKMRDRLLGIVLGEQSNFVCCLLNAKLKAQYGWVDMDGCYVLLINGLPVKDVIHKYNIGIVDD